MYIFAIETEPFLSCLKVVSVDVFEVFAFGGGGVTLQL